MRKSISAVLSGSMFLLFFLLWGNLSGEAAEPLRINKEELKLLLNDPDTTIIDVRREGAWQESDKKIKGAVREDPMTDEKSWAKKYKKDKNIVLYCS